MKDIKLRIHFKKMRKYLGLCYYGKDYIEIEPRQYQSEILITLIHEIVHFLVETLLKGRLTDGIVGDCKPVKVKDIYNLKTKKQRKAAEKLEEDLCEDIAHYACRKIHRFMMKNKA